MTDLSSRVRRRISRQAESPVAGSLLSSQAIAALAGVELEPAGEVMGCLSMRLIWTKVDCLYQSRPEGQIRKMVVASAESSSGYLGARYRAYDTVLARLLAEASGLRADGVVGVSLTWSKLDRWTSELVALGTAVRYRRASIHRTASRMPFCTEFSAQDTAAALLADWRPLRIVVGLSVAVQHGRMGQRYSTGLQANFEIWSLSQLVQQARSEARERLTQRAAAFTGAGQVVVSKRNLQLREQSRRQCFGGDSVAEADFTGTVLARDLSAAAQARRSARQRSRTAPQLSILPLDGPSHGPSLGPAIR